MEYALSIYESALLKLEEGFRRVQSPALADLEKEVCGGFPPKLANVDTFFRRVTTRAGNWARGGETLFHGRSLRASACLLGEKRALPDAGDTPSAKGPPSCIVESWE